jgi:hypothetical protein
MPSHGGWRSWARSNTAFGDGARAGYHAFAARCPPSLSPPTAADGSGRCRSPVKGKGLNPPTDYTLLDG